MAWAPPLPPRVLAQGSAKLAEAQDVADTELDPFVVLGTDVGVSNDLEPDAGTINGDRSDAAEVSPFDSIISQLVSLPFDYLPRLFRLQQPPSTRQLWSLLLLLCLDPSVKHWPSSGNTFNRPPSTPWLRTQDQYAVSTKHLQISPRWCWGCAPADAYF
jgi:hypothetical protein